MAGKTNRIKERRLEKDKKLNHTYLEISRSVNSLPHNERPIWTRKVYEQSERLWLNPYVRALVEETVKLSNEIAQDEETQDEYELQKIARTMEIDLILKLQFGANKSIIHMLRSFVVKEQFVEFDYSGIQILLKNSEVIIPTWKETGINSDKQRKKLFDNALKHGRLLISIPNNVSLEELHQFIDLYGGIIKQSTRMKGASRLGNLDKENFSFVASLHRDGLSDAEIALKSDLELTTVKRYIKRLKGSPVTTQTVTHKDGSITVYAKNEKQNVKVVISQVSE